MLSVGSVGLQCWMQKVKNENKIDYYSDSLVSIALHSLHFIFIFNCDKYNIPWIVVIDVFSKAKLDIFLLVIWLGLIYGTKQFVCL